MTEIAVRRDASPALIPDTAAGLVEWAQAASAAHRLATGLVGTSFVPAAYKNKPEEAAAAILAGSEVGLSPMASLRAFDNIQGTATPKAITIRAVMLKLGCEVEVEESTSVRCIMRGRRSAAANWTTVEWTMDRARKMGLDKKQQWQSQPGAMLVARATSELGRLIAADALLGLGYTAEEVADDQPVPTTPVARARAKVQRAPAPQAPEPEFDEPDHDRPLGTPETASEPVKATAERVEEPITPKQLTALNAALSQDLGFTEREDKLAYLSGELGREIGSSKDVTKAEAMRLLDGFAAGLDTAEPTLDGLS